MATGAQAAQVDPWALPMGQAQAAEPAPEPTTVGTPDYVPPASGMGGIFLLLDIALLAAVTFAWPFWDTEGGGGEVPWRKCFDFLTNTLQHAARVDFSRGTAWHDKPNKT